MLRFLSLFLSLLLCCTIAFNVIAADSDQLVASQPKDSLLDSVDVKDIAAEKITAKRIFIGEDQVAW